MPDIATLPTAPPQPLQAPSQGERLVAELLSTRGNLALASERLGLSLADVLKLLDDPAVTMQLNSGIRNQATLSAYNTLDELATIMPINIGALEPNEAFKAFTTLVAAIASLTSVPKNVPSITLNQQNNIFSPEEAEAARGKLLHFVRTATVTDGDAAIESEVVEPASITESRVS